MTHLWLVENRGVMTRDQDVHLLYKLDTLAVTSNLVRVFYFNHTRTESRTTTMTKSEYFGRAINSKTANPYDLSGFDFFWFCSSDPGRAERFFP
jgi:hypothetical protein